MSNKLRKLQPMSATMALATSNFDRIISSNHPLDANVEVQATGSTVKVQPLTAGEQYWAARALKAEALLTAHESHYKEVKAMEQAYEMKRERELKTLGQEYRDKHATLERLLLFLVVLVVLLLAVIVYLTTHYTHLSMHMKLKQHERWWSAIGASHFTIPILSPFTSVVEQETSVIGAKLLGTLAAIIACLAYFAFRHWSSRQSKRSTSLLTSVTNVASATISRAVDR